ncbi:DNA polymerase III subunit alpha [Bacteroidota bacterium]
MYLNTHSYYSLRYGTLSIDALIEQAKKNNISSFALTDINNSTGILDFVKACTENEISPIAGIEFRNGNTLQFIGIAKNNDGFHELNTFLSEYKFINKPIPKIAPEFNHVYIIYPFNKSNNLQLKDYEFIGIRPSEINKIILSDYVKKLSKLVIQHPVSFKNNGSYELHRNLRAIDNNVVLSKLKPDQLGTPNDLMLPVDQLHSYYEQFPDIIRNTEHIISNCHFNFDFKSYKNKKTFTGNRYDDKILLEKLAMDGLEYRYGKNNKIARKRIIHELEIIDRLGFSSYFLITWDIIRYSLSRGFYHVGRGSGANSVVAYCLKITDVDPIELDLYFERFINPKRSSPPDFDIDYSWKERDEVLDYIFKRYGKNHTALLGTISTFRDKSMYRELGKVYGLPKNEIDTLVENPDAEINKNEITKKIHNLAQKMVDFPNIRSIHAGGVLISENPITYYTALDMPPKGFPTTQWDMYVAEDIGFEKLDILSQRGIGHIKECADIVKENRNISVDVHRVELFKKDNKVKHLLKEGETNGCFYIESPAMRGLLKKLRCDNYLSLVAASSIIRPGVARSGMMREYIQRFHDPNGFEYLHPVMKEQLEETFGVMVYQEDVLKICHHFAGLDLADADVLRRAMSGKFRGKKELDRIINRFFDNCKSRGYPDKIIKEVWRQIDSFAGYSFSKAHSASYAVESFQSLYLKTYYPLEFMVAVINNFGGFYKTWVYFNEAKRKGGHINLPCINNSNYKTCIRGKEIYIGFIHIANLESQVVLDMIKEREKNGEYKDLEDFVNRIRIGIEQLIILIRVNALRFTKKKKPQLLWEAHSLLNKSRNKKNHPGLFQYKSKKFTLPQLEHTSIEDSYDEIELIGFPVTLSYFDLLETSFRGALRAKQLGEHIGETIRMVGLLVTVKYVKTIKKELMHFGTFLDVEGEFFDTVNFPDSLKQYPFKGMGVYLILGTITAEFDFPSITIKKMAKLPIKKDPRDG